MVIIVRVRESISLIESTGAYCSVALVFLFKEFLFSILRLKTNLAHNIYISSDERLSCSVKSMVNEI